MADQRQPGVEIVWHQVAIVERFSSVLYPLDILELLKQIPTIGFVVPELVLRGTPEERKPLATKGDIELVINEYNKTLGVRARDVQKAVESFQELRAFYLDRLDPSPGLATHYVEFEARGWAKSQTNPTEALSRFWADYTRLRDLGKVLGTDVANFGLHLVPPNRDPNGPNWFHITVEPLVASSSKRYAIRWVWREPNTERLLEKFSKFDETLQKLVSKLEGQ